MSIHGIDHTDNPRKVFAAKVGMNVAGDFGFYPGLSFMLFFWLWKINSQPVFKLLNPV